MGSGRRDRGQHLMNASHLTRGITQRTAAAGGRRHRDGRADRDRRRVASRHRPAPVGSPGGVSSPHEASTISHAPPMPLVTTGRPACIASTSDKPNGSGDGVRLAEQIGRVEQHRHIAPLAKEPHAIGNATVLGHRLERSSIGHLRRIAARRRRSSRSNREDQPAARAPRAGRVAPSTTRAGSPVR